jgi:hypothetical protein
MTPIAEAFKKDHPEKKEYLQNELKSLGIEPDHLQNEPNDKNQEFQTLAESIKSIYYQAYKTAYSSNSNNSGSSSLENIQTAEKR